VQFTDQQIWALLRNPARHPPSARHLGFELIDFSVDAGWAEVAFMPWPEFANPAGMVQGGFICAMLEDAMGVTASISQRLARVIGRGEVRAWDKRRRTSRAACGYRAAPCSPRRRRPPSCGRFLK
jgi:acyl-coenzyme A thioesterase PaaI-like protein